MTAISTPCGRHKARFILHSSRPRTRDWPRDHMKKLRLAVRRSLQALMRGFAVGMTAGADGGTCLPARDRFTLRTTIRFVRYPTSAPIMRTGLSLLFDCGRGAHDIASLTVMVSPAPCTAIRSRAGASKWPRPESGTRQSRTLEQFAGLLEQKTNAGSRLALSAMIGENPRCSSPDPGG